MSLIITIITITISKVILTALQNYL